MALALAVVVGCKRSADAPLSEGALYPSATAAPPPSAATGPLIRLATASAVEPDDDAARALLVPPDREVVGAFGDAAAGGAATADAVGNGKRRHAADSDWIRVEPLDPAKVLDIHVAEGPPCLELRVHDRLDGPPLRSARAHGGELPALPSLQPAAAGLWIHLRCAPAKGQASGSWRLIVAARPAGEDDEREPNDRLDVGGRALAVGQALVGTLAPRGDVDVVRLDLTAAAPGAPVLLSVAGVPKVAATLELWRDGEPEPLLRRAAEPGASIAIPNLDVRRLGPRPWLRLSARAGANGADRYAMAVRMLQPDACRLAGTCASAAPVEREPNDARTSAMGVAIDSPISGVLDAADDVDWYVVETVPGQVVGVELTAGPGHTLELAVEDATAPWAISAASAAGETLGLPGRRAATTRLYARVRTLGAAVPEQIYRIRFVAIDDPAYEREDGPEETLHVDEHAAAPRRSGALVPAGDVDRFGLPPAMAPAPGTALEVLLRCRGDGAPGLRCRLRDAAGDVRLAVTPPVDGSADSALVTLPSTAGWAVEVDREGTAAALRPYAVALVVQRAVALPLGATAATDGGP